MSGRHWRCDRGHRNDYSDTHGWAIIWATCPQCPPLDNGPYRVDVNVPAQPADSEGAA